MESYIGKKVIIVGAGPVGSLAALYFSHAGWEVEVYELRGGIYTPSLPPPLPTFPSPRF